MSDMVERGSGSVTALPGKAVPDGAGSSSPETSSMALQEHWRQQSLKARAEIQAALQKLESLEQSLVTFRADLSPLSAAEAQDPLRLQNRAARAAEMAKEVEAQRAALSEARKAMVAFEETARRSGVPPGWLR